MGAVVREPHFRNAKNGVSVPYSKAPDAWLKGFDGPLCVGPNQEELEFRDEGFRRWYAAFILRERRAL